MKSKDRSSITEESSEGVVELDLGLLSKVSTGVRGGEGRLEDGGEVEAMRGGSKDQS